MTAAVLALLFAAARPDSLTPGDHTRTVEVGGRKRTYHVHVPKSYDPKKPTPVVLAFHGAGMNGRMMRAFTALDKKSDEAGFLAVYPDGTGAAGFLVWNAGNFRTSKVDDVAFTIALLDDLAGVAKVDAKRVYAAGLSNGAMMSYRLAAELSDRIAAIAPVAGTMVQDKCEPKHPVPVIHFHGTKDTLVPYGGPGKKGAGRLPFRSVEGSVTAWVKANGCDEEPDAAVVADGEKDGLKVTRKTWTGGREGSEVVLYTVEGGGHTWPGSRAFAGLLGASAMTISANDLMWDFFRRHPRK